MPFIDVVVSHEPNSELAHRLAAGVTERTVRILGRVFEHTAISVRFSPPSDWFVGGRSLAELGKASFWLDVKVTIGTTTKQQKAQYLAEISEFMRAELGELHEVSYLRVDEVAADAWGFGGISQEARRQRSTSA